MTTAMAAHQDSPHERLQVPTEDPEHYIRRQTAAWPLQGSLADNDIVDQSQNEHIQNTRPFYRTPKRNKRKNFKPRCAPNAAVFSDDSNNGDSMGMAYDEPASPNEDVGENRYSPDQLFEEREVMPMNHGKIMKIGVKNFSLLKGPSAVDLTRRFSTDSNENIDHSAPNEEVEGAPRKSDSRFQQSYIQSLRDKTGGVKMTECQTKDMLQPPYTTIASTKSYSAKYPFAISQLIKTNSPPRRRTSVYSEEGERDTNADETGDVQEGEEDLNGDQNTNVTNRMLQEYAANTMTELLGIYGLSSTEFADTITGQMRTLEALQGRSSGTKRRMPWSSAEQPRDRRARRSSSVTTEDDAASPPPASTSPHRHPARHYSSQESLGAPYSRRGSALGSCDADSGASTDGDHTLDLSVSKDGDAQDLSTTSSTGNSVSDYDQHTLLMRKNLEDMANLQMQGFFPKPPSLLEAEDGSSQDTRKLHHSGLLSALNQLDTARKSTSQSAIDYSRYVKRYSSSLECGSSYCKDLGYREHFHCMDCTARVFCKKEEMIRHFKWHKKRDESLAHGFMRYSPLDDCGDRYSDCPHNRSQTHYHCIQDGCDKVYISTSDVQMHANYHRKDSAILQEGFQRFRATETCSAIHCAFQGQRTTHFHCRRPGCTFTFKNKADMEKHKTYHIKDEQLARDGFKKYMKNEPCPYSECRFSRTCNHIHCIRPRCNYVLHSSSQLFSHKRKHERKDHEMGFGLASTVMQSAFLQQQGGVEGTLKRSSSPGSNGLFPSEVEENSLSSLHAYAASAQDLQTDALLPHSNLNQMVLEDIFVKYVETFAGGREPEDKCRKCSAFNKHYHCVANNCKMAHSCQNTMMKHALEHEQQKQVTEAFFITYNKNNPCSGSACNHIRDIAHYHCNWENCGAVILASDDEPLKRLEHHRQHAILSPLSPSVMSRLGPNLASQMSAQLHPNIAAQLGQTMAAMPHTFAPTLQAHLAISQHGGQPVNHPVSQSSSLDEMFSRKRGRPPKNRVVEVWTDNVTPQAIFTSFKLPKSSQPPLVHSPSISTIDDISLQRIKFDNFEVYTAGEACSYSHPHCPIQLSKLHLHCCHCNYAGESHILLEAHARESHAIGILLEGYQYYNSHEQCKVVQCCKNQLRSHFHCIQVPSCRMVVNQYSALAAHKHDPKVADMEMQEMKVEEAKDYSVVREVKSETKHEEVATNFSMKTEVLDKDSPDTSLSPASVSVVKATGTFYPSSHLNKNLAPSPSHQPDGSPRTESRDVKPNFTPTIPPSCHDNHCVLNKKTGHSALNLHYHCPHCSQPYVDLKLLYGHMVKKHSMDSGALGLAATKETLEREYPEISILPSTASASTSPTVRQQNPAEQVHAVQSLLLQQYLSASTAQQQSVKKTSLQEQLKFQQQYNASLATSLTPSHLAHIAFLTQGGSPFPLYPSMLYPPELILEQSLLAGPGQSAPDKEAEAIIKKTHTRTGPHMRVLKDEPIPEGYLRFRFNEDCEYPHCGYREHQTHFHCTRKDCGYSFCDKTRFVQHTARHERLDTLMGGDFQQYRANVYCNRQDCLHASNFGSGQNKASHFHCLKCDFVCTDTNKVVAHRRQHQKMDSIQAAGFEKYPPSKGCGYEPQCIHSRKQTHYHCLQCGFAVLGLSQMTSHKYRHQEANQGAGTSRIS